MYKLVIVEDERDVRMRLASLVARSKHGFTLMAEYETGIDALEGIVTECPDIILTDIKIPYINGIDLVKEVRKVHPLVKVIIITGYNEFDYAVAAANLDVIGFINKPITFEAIDALLKKAKESLEQEYLTASNLNELSAFYENSLPIIREHDLYQLSQMTELTPAFARKLKSSGIDLEFRYFVMCVFDLDETPVQESSHSDLALSGVRKAIGPALEATFDYELFSRFETLCLLLKFNQPPDIQVIEQRIESIILHAGRYFDMPVSVGVSSVYDNNYNFKVMTKEAERALEYRSVMGGGKVFRASNSYQPLRSQVIDDKLVSDLKTAIYQRSSPQEFGGRIDKIGESINSHSDSLYYIATSVLNTLIKACEDLTGLCKVYGSIDEIYRKLFAIKTNREVYDYLKELGQVVQELNDSVIIDNVELGLRKVICYMEAHFCDPDISFEAMAREVNFSVSYISALLKKYLNTSFVKMLTSMRMEKSKELLADPNLKLIDVADQLGYNDSYYFSHCFKRYFGISPKEYRRK